MSSVKKEVEFEGDSLERIKGFPEVAKQRTGYEIHKLQCGENPTNFKPVRNVGAGVFEIRVDSEGSWFRVFYVAKFEEAIYVLHAFSKKQNQTPQQDIDIGKDRYRDLIKRRREK